VVRICFVLISLPTHKLYDQLFSCESCNPCVKTRQNLSIWWVYFEPFLKKKKICHLPTKIKKNKNHETLKWLIWFKDVLRNALVIFYILVLPSCITFQPPVGCLRNPTGNLWSQKTWTAYCSRQPQLQFYQHFSYFLLFSRSELGLRCYFFPDCSLNLDFQTWHLKWVYHTSAIVSLQGQSKSCSESIMTVNGFPIRLLNSSTVY